MEPNNEGLEVGRGLSFSIGWCLDSMMIFKGVLENVNVISSHDFLGSLWITWIVNDQRMEDHENIRVPPELMEYDINTVFYTEYI